MRNQMHPILTPQPYVPKPVLIFSYLPLGLASGLFLSGFAIKILHAFLILSGEETCLYRFSLGIITAHFGVYD
jgi:hypothetical protein